MWCFSVVFTCLYVIVLVYSFSTLFCFALIELFVRFVLICRLLFAFLLDLFIAWLFWTLPGWVWCLLWFVGCYWFVCLIHWMLICRICLILWVCCSCVLGWFALITCVYLWCFRFDASDLLFCVWFVIALPVSRLLLILFGFVLVVLLFAVMVCYFGYYVFVICLTLS